MVLTFLKTSHFLSVFCLTAFLLPGVFLSGSSLACSNEKIFGTDLISSQAIEAKPGAMGTVVVFMSTHCPCSISHEPVLSKLAQEYKDFQFIGIHSNADENPTLAKLHFKEAGLPFPVISDSQYRYADSFGALKTPHAYVIGPKGECLFKGGVDSSREANSKNEAYLKNALDSIKNGKKILVAEARPLGCIIQRIGKK